MISLPFFWHRVIAAWIEGVAARDAPDAHTYSFYNSKPLYRLGGIL
jgi:hypothetical protein